MSLLFEIEQSAIPDISGLTYMPDFITPEEEAILISNIDAQSWLHDLKRRVQHYGYKYDYKARAVMENSYLGELPEWIQPLCNTLYNEQVFSDVPDQVIVNEYLPGQGISPHIDCVPCFNDTIASLSLGAGTMIQFTNHGEKQELYLQPRSLVVLSNKARYEWTHAIPARKSDMISGFKIERERRISLTFRNVILKR